MVAKCDIQLVGVVMKARVCRLYGKQDLRVEIDSVRSPGPDEVLVRVGRGGICGSDLHYFQDGGFGPVRIREPIIIGHEFAGTVEAVGSNVTSIQAGDRVAVNPSQPCGECNYCKNQLPQHCLEMRFIGSALRLPHEQGGFRDRLVITATQCVKGTVDTSVAELACAEPLAVCLHAVKKAGPLVGKKLLINGAGPIGALCIAVAKHYGAEGIVVADLFTKTLGVAHEMGAQRAINITQEPQAFEFYGKDKGYFDVIFECSAAQSALENIFKVIRPLGTIVQVGVSGALSAPINMLVGKEIKWIGSHRFHDEYSDAVALICSRNIDVRPILTDTFPMEEVHLAIKAAMNRSQSVKVQLSFDD